MEGKKNVGKHRMDRRSYHNNYSSAGYYHVTLKVHQGLGRPLGRVVGNAREPDGSLQAPRVDLTAVGRMVEQELTTSITAHYPMIEVCEHVVMPEHVHVLLAVWSTVISSQGQEVHLGQVIAGFKKGCNRRYWEITHQQPAATQPAAMQRAGAQSAAMQRGKPAATMQLMGAPGATPASAPGAIPASAPGATKVEPCLAVSPQGSAPVSPQGSAPIPPQGSAPVAGYKVPSRASTGRTPLFDYGYVDVMPVRDGQLEVQRQYIRNNPRSRLLRSSNRDWLTAKRLSVPTAVSLTAMKGYLQKECTSSQFNEAAWQQLQSRLLTINQPTPSTAPTANGQSIPTTASTPNARPNTTKPMVVCDSYGSRQLLERRLLPVVCHRKDATRFAQQKERCQAAAKEGAVLVSARIAKGEQTIIDEALGLGRPVVLIEDNGFPKVYHPSAVRLSACTLGQLLLLTPWQHHYRERDVNIDVVMCKAMNCVVQALCKTKDSWWKNP